jgi:hypothetical protein
MTESDYFSGRGGDYREDNTLQGFRMDYDMQTPPAGYGRTPYEQPSSLPNLILPDSSTRPLGMDDIKDKTPEAVGYGRNEIYAKHGRAFVNPNYANYFSQQPWYHADPNYRDSDLTPIEQRNALFLHMTELTYDLNGQRNAYAQDSNVPAGLPGSLISDSSSRQIDPDEVSNLSDQQLRFAVNEIYARHGYPFQTAPARNYYSQLSWYQPNPNYSDRCLSWTEERNIEMLRVMELDRKNGWQ